MYIVNQTYL